MNNFSSDTGYVGNREKFKERRLLSLPSRVLHLRYIPSDATEEEVLSLALPFGKITNILMLKGKRQAFLEMATEENAVNMMNYYAHAAPLLHDQPVFIQYSNHRELRTDNMPNQTLVANRGSVDTNRSMYGRANQVMYHEPISAPKAALLKLCTLSDVAIRRAQGMLQTPNAMQFGSQAVTNVSDDGDDFCPGHTCVLRIIAENVFYPITLEMLHQVLSTFGSVLKIVTFTKYSTFQALVQYDDPRSAHCAKMSLNGQSIHASGCTLRVEFSKFNSLTVKYNNEKSRDFTRFDLPSGDGQIYMDQPIAAAYGTQNNIVPSCTGAAGFTPAMGFTQGTGHLVPPVPGAVGALAVITPAAPEQTTPGVSENSVLLVTNLNPEAITPHGLFILFGIYGNVHRVKIMFRTKEKALIQMADAHQARLAISNLDGQRLYGRVLHATFSKHHTVQLLRKGQDDQGLTKDYSNSPLHRFKIPGSKNFQNIFPPSATLHLSNIPSLVTVNDMKNLFARTGCTVKAFRFFRSNCKMALIQLGSVEEAVHALIELHNYDLGQNRNLRVSFAKFTI